MGGGAWTHSSYDSYTKTTRGVSATAYAALDNLNVQQVYHSNYLSPVLNPKNITRLCHDCDEHPETKPVILALDVTGSMGGASIKVSQKLGEIMTKLYDDPDVKDIEFCIMGIGDCSYDDAPIQMSQFESDVRIAEQLDKIYFEGGGGGNAFESYSAAWYMGTRHCELDCWKRGQKGLIITMGDEGPNPHLPKYAVQNVIGDNAQADVETKDIYTEACEKFDIYHISVDDKESSYKYHQRYNNIDQKWRDLLGEDHYTVATLETLANVIIDIIRNHVNNYSFYATSESISSVTNLQTNENNEVVW